MNSILILVDVAFPGVLAEGLVMLAFQVVPGVLLHVLHVDELLGMLLLLIVLARYLLL